MHFTFRDCRVDLPTWDDPIAPRSSRDYNGNPDHYELYIDVAAGFDTATIILLQTEGPGTGGVEAAALGNFDAWTLTHKDQNIPDAELTDWTACFAAGWDHSDCGRTVRGKFEIKPGN
jgi:hypothetical protein